MLAGARSTLRMLVLIRVAGLAWDDLLVLLEEAGTHLIALTLRQLQFVDAGQPSRPIDRALGKRPSRMLMLSRQG